MRWLRNLPIAFKITLSQGLALALLAALTVVVERTMDAQGKLDARANQAIAAERDGRQTIAAMRDAQLRIAQLQEATSLGVLQNAHERADMLFARSDRLLGEMASAASDPRAQGQVRMAIGAVDSYREQVNGAVALRSNEIGNWDQLRPIAGAFEKSASEVERLANGIEVEPRLALRQPLRSYLDAIRRAREAVLMFLATKDFALDKQLEADANTARQAESDIRAVELPQIISTPMDQLLQSGDNSVATSLSLLDSAANTDSLFRENIEPARRSVEGQLDAAISTFADLAVSARTEAAAGLVRARRSVLLLAGGIALVLVLSSALTARSIARPIGAMTRVVQRMAAGDTAVAVGFTGRRDELGRIAAALETLRQAVARAFVQSQMIEQMPIGVMTAEASGEFRITYCNAATRETLAPAASALPVPADQLVGQSIDIFHKQPEQQRAILADPDRLPHRERLRLGDDTLELLVSPLRGADGSYIGPMLTWHSKTAQEQLAQRFERSVADIAATVGRAAAAMADTAAGMRSAAVGGGEQLSVAATASQNATGHVQAVAASAEELAASVREIGRQVAESARIAADAVAQAQATDRSVAALAEAATRIGDVVNLIRDIAGRTNLLALNATIEAARAGEAGRGFAVVAGEVKTLANQTAKATEEIGGQIAAMQGETTQAVSALHAVGDVIRRMSEIATTIAGAVEEQTAATAEIARSVQQVASGTAQVDSTIAEVGDAVRRTGTEAEQVVQATATLGEEATTLSREVGEFLQALKAA